MKRELPKNSAAKRLQTRKQWQGMLILFFGLIILSSVSYLGYKNHAQRAVIAYWQKLHIWIAERKKNLHTNVIKAKQFADAKEATPPPIHFEFYTALPNMRMDNDIAVAEKPMLTDMATTSAPKKSITRASIINAKTVEAELAAHIHEAKKTKTVNDKTKKKV